MKKRVIALSLAASMGIAASLVAGLSCAAGAPPAQAASRHAHRVSMAQARRTALARVPGEVKAEELEHERGRWIYSFEIRPPGEKGSSIREVNVDADTGRIVDVHTEKD